MCFLETVFLSILAFTVNFIWNSSTSCYIQTEPAPHHVVEFLVISLSNLEFVKQTLSSIPAATFHLHLSTPMSSGNTYIVVTAVLIVTHNPTAHLLALGNSFQVSGGMHLPEILLCHCINWQNDSVIRCCLTSNTDGNVKSSCCK